MPCSTFMLKQGDAFLIGHNLDDSTLNPDGAIYINKRGITKRNISFHEILTGQPTQPTIHWTAKYGSVTFNTWGREFIDGGINEAGFYIQEMTLEETVYPQRAGQPVFFMQQWMQYLLDNFATVAEALDALNAVSIDGWPWHFFLADRAGNYSIVQFLDGTAQIHTGTGTIPVLCNTRYTTEQANLQHYAGFGGQEVVDLHDPQTERFVHAAYLLQTAPPQPTVEDAFTLLKHLERTTADLPEDDPAYNPLNPESRTRWAYVIDVTEQRVYYSTCAAPQRKFFDLSACDYDCQTPVQMLNIHADLAGNVTAAFRPYVAGSNQHYAEALLDLLTAPDGTNAFVTLFGGTRENIINAISNYPESLAQASSQNR